MKVKVIKKSTQPEETNNIFYQAPKTSKNQNLEKKLSQNILGWVNDLREKKQFEVMKAQQLLNNFS